MPGAEVIHISSHLVVDAANQCGILLCPNSPSAPALLLDADDSQSSETKPSTGLDALVRARALLTPAEISQLKLSAAVVVLSFGHSALGNPHSSDQTLKMQKNLKRLVDAFLVAGAKSVVVSLFSR